MPREGLPACNPKAKCIFYAPQELPKIEGNPYGANLHIEHYFLKRGSAYGTHRVFNLRFIDKRQLQKNVAGQNHTEVQKQ
jgi:hypothetical protein